MDSAIWICIFLPMFLLLLAQQQTNKWNRQQNILQIIKNRKARGEANMSEIIKRHIGKDCIITTMNENIMGVIEAVEDGWVVVSADKGRPENKEIVKIDYISRIREHPRNKNGRGNLLSPEKHRKGGGA